jgi:hypothetical protein
MDDPDSNRLTPEQERQYRAQLACMGWPVDKVNAPACGPLKPSMHFVVQVGVLLLAACDVRGASE